MNLPRFIQIHTLHNYPGALLNRDDAGLATARGESSHRILDREGRR